jgi:hypothetical protein
MSHPEDVNVNAILYGPDRRKYYAWTAIKLEEFSMEIHTRKDLRRK